MFKLTSNSRHWLRFLGFGFPLVIALNLIHAQPANACKPAPGSNPATLAERVNSTLYVFEGIVKKVKGNTLTIRVNQYFKGSGPRVVKVTGFNTHSCSNFITETEGRFVFFAEAKGKQPWVAVYDGAFGFCASLVRRNIRRVKKAGFGSGSRFNAN